MTKHERDLRAQNGSVVTAPPLIKAAAKARTAPTKPALAPAPPRRRTSSEEDLTSKLERLTALHDAGALTDGEFSAAKAHVLSGD
jgi:hypothetical protein